MLYIVCSAPTLACGLAVCAGISCPLLAAEVLGRRLSSEDKDRISSNRVDTVRKYIDHAGKRRCVGVPGTLKSTQLEPQLCLTRAHQHIVKPRCCHQRSIKPKSHACVAKDVHSFIRICACGPGSWSALQVRPLCRMHAPALTAAQL